MLLRSNGSVQDLRQPLEDGQQIQIVTTRDKDDPDALYVLAALGRASARRGGPASLPGREDRDRPADRERLLLRLRVPGADPRGRPREDRGRDRARAEGGPRVVARGDRRRRGEADLLRAGRELQGGARRHRGRADHPLHAGRLHRPLPRSAPPELEADQGAQAHEPRRRVLARRRAQQAADADLRHRLLLAGGSRPPPRAAGRGAQARPPPARARPRPVPPLRALAGLAVLAPEGNGDLERARGSAPRGELGSAATRRSRRRSCTTSRRTSPRGTTTTTRRTCSSSTRATRSAWR